MAAEMTASHLEEGGPEPVVSLKIDPDRNSTTGMNDDRIVSPHMDFTGAAPTNSARMLGEANALMDTLNCKHKTRHVDAIPAPWNIARALMEYNRMLGFSISRPIVRFRGIEDTGDIKESHDPALLEIWDPINFTLHTLDPKLIQLPIDVNYKYGGFNSVGRLLSFMTLRSHGFTTNMILNAPSKAIVIMRANIKYWYMFYWFLFIAAYMGLSGYLPITWMVVIVVILPGIMWLKEYRKRNMGLLDVNFAIWLDYAQAGMNKEFLLQVTQLVSYVLMVIFAVARVGNLANMDSDNMDSFMSRRKLMIEEDGLFFFGLKDGARRLANQPQRGFFCDVEHDSPTSYPTPEPTFKPSMVSLNPTASPTISSSPTKAPTIDTDDGTVFLCDTTDQGLLYFSFVIYLIFVTVWMFRLAIATQIIPLPAGEEIPDDEKIMWKVTLTYCTPKYVWNVASQVGHALPAKPGMDQRLIGGFANIATAANGGNFGGSGNFSTVTFNASKSAIDALNDGIYQLSRKKGAEGLFIKYEHEVACAMMNQGEGGPLAVRLLNQKHAPEQMLEVPLAVAR